MTSNRGFRSVPPELKRSKMFGVCVTPAEFDLIKVAAKRTGKNVSEYMRQFVIPSATRDAAGT